MIPEETKLSIAMDYIEEQIAKCMIKRRNSKDESIEIEFENLINKRNEIYNGNEKVINNIINEIRSNND